MYLNIAPFQGKAGWGGKKNPRTTKKTSTNEEDLTPELQAIRTEDQQLLLEVAQNPFHFYSLQLY